MRKGSAPTGHTPSSALRQKEQAHMLSLSLFHLRSAEPPASMSGCLRGAGVTHFKYFSHDPVQRAQDEQEMSNICGRRRAAEIIPLTHTRKKNPEWLEFKQMPNDAEKAIRPFF